MQRCVRQLAYSKPSVGRVGSAVPLQGAETQSCGAWDSNPCMGGDAHLEQEWMWILDQVRSQVRMFVSTLVTPRTLDEVPHEWIKGLPITVGSLSGLSQKAVVGS